MVMDETIYTESNLGKRLNKVKKTETGRLIFKDKTIPLICKIVIGRDRSNNAFIDDKLVSRFHAVIQKIKDSYFVMDLHSTNGTFVNGKRVPQDKYVKLKTNDVILVGKTELTIL